MSPRLDMTEAVAARFRRLGFFEAVDMLGQSTAPPVLRFARSSCVR